MRREDRSDHQDAIDRDLPHVGGPTPGKSNRAAKTYAGLPPPASAPPLDWGAALLAPREPASAAAEAAPGPGYGLSQAEGEMALAVELLQKTQSLLVPAYRAAVDAIDGPAALQLAQAIVSGVSAAVDRMRDARARAAAAHPHAQLISRPDGAEALAPGADDVAEAERIGAELERRQETCGAMIDWVLARCSVVLFRGQPVPGLAGTMPPPHGDPVAALVRETSIVVDILVTVGEITALIEGSAMAGPEALEPARALVRQWRSRPATYLFLRQVLLHRGWWGLLVRGSDLEEIHDEVIDQAGHTGAFGDVGAWDARRARQLLTRDRDDWAVTDDDAREVVDMIASASPATRADLILQLDSMGKLGALCDNLPWRQVQAMWDAIEDPDARARLGPHWAGKGGGESLTRIYDRSIRSEVALGRYGEAFQLVMLDKAHSALTFGFKDVHDAAYDANQDGWISDDAYWSTTGKAAARSTAIMASTMVTGGAAGAWGEGAALGLGAGRTTAQVIGGGLGGAASGAAGQLTGDAFDVAFMGADGFGSLSDYATATALGGLTGALTAGVQAAGTKYLPDSAKSMSQLYAERYPELDNVLTRIRNRGVRSGLSVRATAQELQGMVRAGLLDGAALGGRLERIRQVHANQRIDVNDVTLTRVMPASDIEKFYGPINRRSGRVTVKNPDPTAARFVAVAEDISPEAMTTDESIRETLGIDARADWYNRYKESYDPIYQVTFKTRVELDVPLPQDNATWGGYRTLGGYDSGTSHRPGVGRTKGDVREGLLPIGAPIEILEIVPIGERHGLGNYPPPGTLEPSPRQGVRNLGAPLAGATADAAFEDVDAHEDHDDDLDAEFD